MLFRHEFATDIEAITAKQHLAWTSGNYGVVGVNLQNVGEDLAQALDLFPGACVLDVAAGNGNATLAFGRRWYRVTSTDQMRHLLEKCAERTRAEGLEIDFQLADAENLPFSDGQFDAVVSTFGVMFAPNQTKVATELMRVTRRGGKIGLANWMPEGFIGRLFRVVGCFDTPPAGVKSPALWGDEVWLNTRFSDAKSVQVARRSFYFRYRSPNHFIEVFRNLYGPVHKAFLALPDDEWARLTRAIEQLIAEFNTARDGSVCIEADYLEVQIAR